MDRKAVAWDNLMLVIDAMASGKSGPVMKPVGEGFQKVAREALQLADEHPEAPVDHRALLVKLARHLSHVGVLGSEHARSIMDEASTGITDAEWAELQRLEKEPR